MCYIWSEIVSFRRLNICQEQPGHYVLTGGCLEDELVVIEYIYTCTDLIRKLLTVDHLTTRSSNLNVVTVCSWEQRKPKSSLLFPEASVVHFA
jgi:hypothetical protein